MQIHKNVEQNMQTKIIKINIINEYTNTNINIPSPHLKVCIVLNVKKRKQGKG